MLEVAGSPFRLWGYGVSLQAISLTQEGLTIRNGDSQVLIPREGIRYFQEQLALMMAESGEPVEQPSAAHGA